MLKTQWMELLHLYSSLSLGGPMGAILYRTANTMDSMLGYKNQKYLYFGRVAARFDDLH